MLQDQKTWPNLLPLFWGNTRTRENKRYSPWNNTKLQWPPSSLISKKSRSPLARPRPTKQKEGHSVLFGTKDTKATEIWSAAAAVSLTVVFEEEVYQLSTCSHRTWPGDGISSSLSVPHPSPPTKYALPSLMERGKGAHLILRTSEASADMKNS